MSLQRVHTFPLHPCSSDRSRQHGEASCWAGPPGQKSFGPSPAGLDSSMTLMPRSQQQPLLETTELLPRPDPVVDLKGDLKRQNVILTLGWTEET